MTSDPTSKIAEFNFAKRFTPKEASKIIQKSIAWLQADRCGNGLIPFLKHGSRVFYLEEDLRSHLESLPKFRTTSEFLPKNNKGKEGSHASK